MFWSILKKDLKRKKTMNVILLLFIILCSMFAAASVNNIAAVTGGIDYYFDEAGVPELMIMIECHESDELADELRELSCVSEIKKEEYTVVMDSKSFSLHGKKLTNFISNSNLLSDEEMALNYYDEDNNVISDVGEGCFYVTAPFLQGGLDIKKGDKVEVTVDDVKLELTYSGRFKGAVFGNEDSYTPFIILNKADYDLIKNEQSDASHDPLSRLYVSTDDTQAVIDYLEGRELYCTTREEAKDLYIYDMFAAYIMLVISVVLMITAFIVLRFTIGFTISEEFREIGVMKAVGIKNRDIRQLYIVKYLAIAVIGSLVGFVCSIPLTNMMLDTVSENMVLGSSQGSLLGAASVAAVILVIMLFCYGCTRRVKKLSPIDAVRTGQTGERFGKKSILVLGKSKLPYTGFMALNDVLSAPKQFAVISTVFALCVLLITLVSSSALTLKSEKLLPLFDVAKSEAHILDLDYLAPFFSGENSPEEMIEKTEKMLEENGMPAECAIMCEKTNNHASLGDKTSKVMLCYSLGNIDSDLSIEEGFLPKKDDEIAVSKSVLEELGAKIGDSITIELDSGEKEFIITGLHSTFSVHAVYMRKGMDAEKNNFSNCMGIQIHFKDSPDKAQIDKNIEKIKDILGTDKVMTTSDMMNTMTGMSDTLNAIKKMMMILTVIVTALIVVLMERSFISKEKSEIALMKAVGIRSGSIIRQHALRFMIAAVIACIAASAVVFPLSDIMMSRICTLIGDVISVKCDHDIIETFVIAPAILIGVTVIGSLLTALYTKTIKAADTASIE